MIDSKSVGKEHERGSAAHRNYLGHLDTMTQPFERMRVTESDIPIENLYNGMIDKLKQDHENHNMQMRDMFLPQDPP